MTISRKSAATANGLGTFMIRTAPEWSLWNSSRPNRRAATPMKPGTQGREIGVPMKKWRVASDQWRAKERKLSLRARPGICFAVACFLAFASLVGAEPKRPKILKIAYVRILVSDPNAAANFYS